MATPFETFIQTELPLRGFLPADVAQESVIIRRGAGPRQFDGVPLADGQVLGRVGGVLVGVTQTAVNFVAPAQETPSLTWTINHGRNNKNAIVLLRDADDKEITADEVQFNANSVVITFTVPQAGTAVVIFLG